MQFLAAAQSLLSVLNSHSGAIYCSFSFLHLRPADYGVIRRFDKTGVSGEVCVPAEPHPHCFRLAAALTFGAESADYLASERAFTASGRQLSPMPGRLAMCAKPSRIRRGSCRKALAQSTYSK